MKSTILSLYRLSRMLRLTDYKRLFLFVLCFIKSVSFRKKKNYKGISRLSVFYSFIVRSKTVELRALLFLSFWYFHVYLSFTLIHCYSHSLLLSLIVMSKWNYLCSHILMISFWCGVEYSPTFNFIFFSINSRIYVTWTFPIMPC